MINEYKKGKSFSLSTHFGSFEFDCHCKEKSCNYTLVDSDLIDALEELRKKVKPIHITSGFRCSIWNKSIGGKPGSFHLLGKACDLFVEGLSIASLYYYVIDIPEFDKGGVGVYDQFVHCDVRKYRSRWNG